jgi:hypothetical protein
MSTTQRDSNPPVSSDVTPEALEDTQTLFAVARWARPFLAEDDVPAFGSPEWVALGPHDPRFAAAVVRAALAWWRAGEPLEVLETAYAAEGMKRALAEAGPYNRDSLVKVMKTFAELDQDRHLPARRPTDHPGGPVAAW